MAADRRLGILLFTMFGLTGFFLSRAVLSFFQLNEILENLRGLRYFIDFAAALFASFVVASLNHYTRP